MLDTFKKYIFAPAIALALAAVASMASSCDRHKPTDSSTSGITTLICDATIQNIISQEVDVFEFTYPKASIMTWYTDEHSAIDSLVTMKSSLIITARQLTDKQKEYLKTQNRNVRTQQIAVDAIAIIVNTANNIDELSIGELREIMTGKAQRWDDVFPSKLGKIQVVFDHAGSSTVKYVTDSILRGEKFTDEVYACQNCQEVFKEVEKRKNSIGVIGVSWITADLESADTDRRTMQQKVADLQKNDTSAIDFTNRIKVLKIRRDNCPIAYKPYQLYIYEGNYPLYRSIYVTTTAPNGSLAHGFYSFLTGFIGQKIILGTGVMPAVVHPRMVSLE